MLVRSSYTNFVAGMKNLARHIELLLRDHDCVILPGFGGFIAHTVPAYYVSEEHLYYPPSRTVSFNASLTMNDGLLAQSYMHTYKVDYAKATYLVDVAIDKLYDALDEKGEAIFPHIGTLQQDIHRTVYFTPEEAGIASPHHFGLSSFLIHTLEDMQETVNRDTARQSVRVITQTDKTIDLHINKGFLRQVATSAAAILLLLMISLPVGEHKPTDIASLQLIPSTTCQPDIAGDIPDPLVIEEATQPSAEIDTSHLAVTPEVIQPSTDTPHEKSYHIIVASLPNHRGANETLNNYIAQGYTQTSLVERDGRVRISIVQFSEKDAANDYLKELRTQSGFESAWLLPVRNQ